MSNKNYRRNVDELRALASIFWPAELSEEEERLSIIPKLLETQDEFMAILGVPVANLIGLFEILNTSVFPGNLFLKHLTVLADFGGEQLQRLNSYFDKLFPRGEIEYRVNNQSYDYRFQCLPVSGKLTSRRLGISGKQLLNKKSFSKLY